MTAVHKITGDFYDDPYDLIALHSSLEDYELVYFINLYLKSKFRRCKHDMELSPQISFPIFEWKDEKNDRYWSLVTNNSVQEEHFQRADLFQGEPSYTTHHLVPEYKEVDFFLKVEHDDLNLEDSIIKTLLRVPKIITAYTVDTDKLKSKNNLIFL
tara:strand:+ start:131 stop:598 length:468 start_codon:yes stop_codon:yes gene_type:complete